MSPPRRTLAAAAVALALLLSLSGCATFSAEGRQQYQRAMNTGARQPRFGATGRAPEAVPTVLPYDIRPLLKPAGKYLGVATKDAPGSLRQVRTFATQAGKRPNLIEYYSAWGDRFEAADVRRVWSYGALPFITWEPFKSSLARIAAGHDDAYIRRYADAVRDLNIPVAMSFGHEMNGFWYPWGTRKATAAEFTAAWKRIHDVFEAEGATTVIWVWSPNVVNPMPRVKLRPYWPGDDYVDWIGVIGYYAEGAHTFDTLYGPTMSQVRTFTQRPFFIAETAAQAGERKPADIQDLLTGTASRDDVVGFAWFDFDKETDWRIASSPASLATFRRYAADPRLGFDVRNP